MVKLKETLIVSAGVSVLAIAAVIGRSRATKILNSSFNPKSKLVFEESSLFSSVFKSAQIYLGAMKILTTDGEPMIDNFSGMPLEWRFISYKDELDGEAKCRFELTFPTKIRHKVANVYLCGVKRTAVLIRRRRERLEESERVLREYEELKKAGQPSESIAEETESESEDEESDSEDEEAESSEQREA